MMRKLLSSAFLGFVVIVGRATILLIVALFMGCATGATKKPGYLATADAAEAVVIKTVGLTAGMNPPEIESVDLGYTRGEGAAGGAAGGALQGAEAALDALGNCTDEFCGAAFLLLLPVLVVGGVVVGAVSGAASGNSADMLAEAEANAHRMLNSAYLEESVLQRAQEYGHRNIDVEFVRTPNADAEAPSSELIDAVLEIDLLRLSMKHCLEMDARARLISTYSGEVLSAAEYKYVSECRQVEDWMANGATPLTESIDRGLQTLAEDIVDENFLLFYPDGPAQKESTQAAIADAQPPVSRSRSVPHYVLSPTYPPLDFCFICDGLFNTGPQTAIGNLEFVSVDDLQPTLQWERFPRTYDLMSSDGRPRQFTDVRYDIRIFDTSPQGIVLVPAQLVYSSRGVSEPYHRIQTALDPCTDYFWTVRARFKLDGRVRVTEWAGAFEVAGWSEQPWNLRRGLYWYPKWFLGIIAPDGPEWFYYPFRTPCE